MCLQVTDSEFKGMHAPASGFDLSFDAGHVDDSKFYDFNQGAGPLDEELGTTTGFASAHRGEEAAREAALCDAARCVSRSVCASLSGGLSLSLSLSLSLLCLRPHQVATQVSVLRLPFDHRSL